MITRASSERFVLLEPLHEGPVFSLHRARDTRDGAVVVLKRLSLERASQAHVERLRHEYAILRELDVPGVVKPRELHEQSGEMALVLEDFRGESLASLLARERPDLATCLKMAAELAGTLGQIHGRQILHKDIHPKNILVDAELHTQIIDFGLATRAARDIPAFANPHVLAGTLATISPEQTGRMSAPVDDRADLYSLGATLYILFTGRPPFLTRDPLELVHAHVARMPEPPSALDPAVPQVVSDIVMKLLQKAAEDRYQSAFGLRADLEACLARLDARGHVAPFPLGRSDVHDRFQLPQKLYGREREVAALEAALDRVAEGTAELVLVSGASGVGKSAVIQELVRAAAKRPGLLGSGKFEPQKSDIPYSAVLTALDEVCRYLLAEPEARLAAWRTALGEAVGGAGRVLSDVLPALELILGEQPSVPELGPAAARNRFGYLFQRLFRALCPPGQPLILFLDDLQWADVASLELIERLLDGPERGPLLVIGAYRDDEGEAARRLADRVEAAGCRASHLTLEPLSAAGVAELVADTLRWTREDAGPLGEIVWRKTRGNTFFARQFLRTLHQDRLLWFDPARGAWAADTARIAAAPITENVVHLVLARIGGLRARTQAVLRVAACIGGRFDRATLALACGMPEDDVAAALDEAHDQELVLSLGTAYRFLHDRVEQAFYDAEGRAAHGAVHHRIAEILLEERRKQPREEQEEGLFDLLHHVNLAADRFTAREQRTELARLDLAAGRRARAAGAFAAAAAYYAAATRFLPDDAFRAEPDLAFAVGLGSAEGAVLNGRLAEAERLFATLLREARTDLERARAYHLKAELSSHRGAFKEGVDAALSGLLCLGIRVSPRPGMPAVLLEAFQARRAIGGRSPAELLALPALTDPRSALVSELIRAATQASFSIAPSLFAVLGLRGVTLCATHGNMRVAPSSYVSYAAFLRGAMGDYAQMAAFGQLSRDILQRYPDKAIEPIVTFAYGLLIQPWIAPFRATFPTLREAHQQSLEVGDFTNAAASLSNLVTTMFVAGCELDEVLTEAGEAIDFARTTQTLSMLPAPRICQRAALALQGKTKSPTSWDAEESTERAFVEALLSADSKLAVQLFRTLKAATLFVLGEHAEAHAVCEAARGDVAKLIGAPPWITEYYHYSSLAHAALATSASPLERQRLLLVIRGNQRKMKTWAQKAPMNFRHKHLLVEAELARLREDDHAAIQRYEEAIAAAREHRFVRDEAVALERTGAFYLARGVPAVARLYLARARSAYDRWGAHAKVALLDRAHPGLERAAAEERSGEISITSTAARSITSRVLDAPTMVKASQALSGEISLEKLLTRLMQVVVESAGAERGALLLRRERGGELRVEAEVSPEGGPVVFSPPAPIDGERRLSPAILHYVARTQKGLVLADASREGLFVRDPYVEAHRPRSVLCMPLVQQGELVGLLYLENNLAAAAFTGDRIELLQVICAQMAISVDNASLYANLERKVVERTRELREAQARLMKLEREAAEVQMAGGFAHEMRNALSSAQMILAVGRRKGRASLCAENSETLKDLYLDLREEISPERRSRTAERVRRIHDNEQRLDDILAQIDRSLSRGLGITDQILSYSQVGRELPGQSEVLVLPLVAELLREAEADLAAHRIEVSVSIDGESVLVGRPDHLGGIVGRLLKNARDAIVERTDDGPRQIQIAFAAGSEGSVLRVSDTGVGIPPENRDKIFKPFFSTRPSTGTGLGLAMVEKLVSLYRGAIAFESEPGRGTTFTITLPPPAALHASSYPSNPPPPRPMVAGGSG